MMQSNVKSARYVKKRGIIKSENMVRERIFKEHTAIAVESAGTCTDGIIKVASHNIHSLLRTSFKYHTAIKKIFVNV